MPLNKTKELAQVVDESILPLEHSGGDGWTILHGDTLQIIRAFKPQVFDALITDPPTLRAVEASEKNRTTNQKYSSMNPKNALPDFDGITGTSEAGQDGWQSGCPTPGKPAGRERLSACSSTGGSTLPSPTLCNGPDGSGEDAWCGIR